MSKLPLIIVGLAVAASVALTMAVERRSANRQTAQAEALREQAAQFSQAAAENARLSNLVARVKTSESLSTDQLRDLLRLRNEAGQLYRLADQKAALEATNAQLHELEKRSKETLDRARASPNYWPKDQLAFAGYADPESTVRSMLTAMKNGDFNAMKGCFPAAAAADLDAELKKDGGDPAAKETEIANSWSDFIGLADGFHIVDQTVTDSNHVTINLSFDGQGRVQKIVLGKIGSEWKLDGGD